MHASLIKIFLLLSVLVLQVSTVFGQNPSALKFYFESDTISAEHGKTFTNRLVVENTSGQELKIEKLLPESSYPGILLLPANSFILKADEKKQFSIKFIVNTDFMKMKSSEIRFNLSYSTANEKSTINTSFWIKKEDEKQLAIYSSSRENYITPSEKETQVSLFLENRSYSNRTIKLSFKSEPDHLEISPRQQTIALEPQEKKWIEVKVTLKHRSSFFPDYNLQVEATDIISNENVGSTYIKIIALSNNRQILRNVAPQSGKNFVEIGHNGNSSGTNYFQLRGNTEFLVGEDIEGRFNLNTDYFLDGNYYNLYDTWFELESKKSQLRLGNINANEYDYSVSGRGVKANTEVISDKNIEVFALETNYSLYGNYFRGNPSSKIAGAKFEYKKANDSRGKASYLFDYNPEMHTESHLAHWASIFNLGSRSNLQVEAGLSYEKGKVNIDENGGGSAVVNYGNKWRNWDFQSINSYATKSYVGLNRGSFNVNQNLSYKVAKQQRINLQYQVAQVEPEYLRSQRLLEISFEDNNRTKYFYSKQSAQLGYQLGLNKWNFLLAPQVEKQKNINSTVNNEFLSYRLRTDISTTFGMQGINLSAEYSYSKAGDLISWFPSFRSTLSYRFRNFGLNGSIQANPKDVIELNQFNNTNEDFIGYNVYASYNFQNSNRSFSGSITAGTNYSGLYKNKNQNLTGNLEYKFSSSWATTAHGTFSNFKSTQDNGYAGNNYQFRVGIKKYFINATSAGNYKVSLQLFEDKNANGKLDVGETILSNQAVKLNDFIAITDQNGRVTFQNVPKGSYTLKVNQTGELMLMRDPVIMVNQNLKLPVGLVRNNKVKGKLVEVKQAYDVLETDIRGIMVYARNEKGEVQTTVVNQNDEFEFFLKEGEYDVYIENDKYNYVEASKRIKVFNTIDSENILFEYSKKNTVIKVKKF